MAKSQVYKKSAASGGVSFNAVPLVDVVFLMILFFILTSQISSQSLGKVELPQPTVTQAIDVKDLNVRRLIVNIILSDEGKSNTDSSRIGEPKEYMIDGERIPVAGGGGQVSNIMKTRYREVTDPQERKEFFIEIRADQNVKYSAVEPVIQAAADAGIPKMNIAVMMSQ